MEAGVLGDDGTTSLSVKDSDDKQDATLDEPIRVFNEHVEEVEITDLSDGDMVDDGHVQVIKADQIEEADSDGRDGLEEMVRTSSGSVYEEEHIVQGFFSWHCSAESRKKELRHHRKRKSIIAQKKRLKRRRSQSSCSIFDSAGEESPNGSPIDSNRRVRRRVDMAASASPEALSDGNGNEWDVGSSSSSSSPTVASRSSSFYVEECSPEPIDESVERDVMEVG